MQFRSTSSDVEQEVHDVAVLDDVVLTLDPHLAGGADGRLGLISCSSWGPCSSLGYKGSLVSAGPSSLTRDGHFVGGSSLKAVDHVELARLTAQRISLPAK